MPSGDLAPPPLSPDPRQGPSQGPIDVALRDGTRVLIRPIRPDDAPALQRFHLGLSDRTIYQRHFRALPVLSDAQARYYTTLDGIQRFALVALAPDAPDEIIGVVRYDREEDDTAEYAALIADQWQRRGLGSAMTRRLIQEAAAHGVRALYALVLPGNQGMLALLHALGLPERRRFEDGVERVDILLTAADPTTDNRRGGDRT